MKEELWKKLERAQETLRKMETVIVAFSGGVDSTLLAKIARDELGKENLLVVTADSPSLAREDLNETTRLARQLDLNHLVIKTDETSKFDYRANSKNRCYICKKTLFDDLNVLAGEKNIPFVLYGAIGDDLLPERPGQIAAVECDIRAPLQEVGLSKTDVRELARALGIPNWDRPQNACLSSRIPHGLEVTEGKLKQIEDAEFFVRSLGFHQVRVRHHESTARIEVERHAISRLLSADIQEKIRTKFNSLGFKEVAIDPLGYRAGGADSNEEVSSSSALHS